MITSSKNKTCRQRSREPPVDYRNQRTGSRLSVNKTRKLLNTFKDPTETGTRGRVIYLENHHNVAPANARHPLLYILYQEGVY